jgi:hypothetical protein
VNGALRLEDREAKACAPVPRDGRLPLAFAVPVRRLGTQPAQDRQGGRALAPTSQSSRPRGRSPRGELRQHPPLGGRPSGRSLSAARISR